MEKSTIINRTRLLLNELIDAGKITITDSEVMLSGYYQARHPLLLKKADLEAILQNKEITSEEIAEYFDCVCGNCLSYNCNDSEVFVLLCVSPGNIDRVDWWLLNRLYDIYPHMAYQFFKDYWTNCHKARPTSLYEIVINALYPNSPLVNRSKTFAQCVSVELGLENNSIIPAITGLPPDIYEIAIFLLASKDSVLLQYSKLGLGATDLREIILEYVNSGDFSETLCDSFKTLASYTMRCQATREKLIFAPDPLFD